MILGPTEHRVARYLDSVTRDGRVTLRTMAIAETLQLERSEAYRILARLRVLGLFGIENDRAGNKGGRRIWRTRIEHDGAELDPSRHRTAWARVVAWARSSRDRLHRSLRELRAHHIRPGDGGLDPSAPPTPTGLRPDRPLPLGDPGGTFAERMRRHGLGGLMDSWRIP